MSSERESERSEDKVERVPFGGFRLKMQLSDADMKGFEDRGMVTHWFNDVEGRIQRALAGGYNYVDEKHAKSLGQSALHRGSTSLSSIVSIVVSRGHPVIEAVLMEIKKEFYAEDQVKKEAVNAQVDEALALGGKTGGSEFENAYKPN